MDPEVVDGCNGQSYVRRLYGKPKLSVGCSATGNNDGGGNQLIHN